MVCDVSILCPLFLWPSITCRPNQFHVKSFFPYSRCNELKSYTPVFQTRSLVFKKLLWKFIWEKSLNLQQPTCKILQVSLTQTYFFKNPDTVFQKRLRSSHWSFLEISVMKDVSFLLKNQLTIFRKIIEEKQVFCFCSFGELYCLNICIL